jgi:hypothetical protein
MLTRIKTLIASAVFWALALLLGGAVLAGVGVGVQFGTGAGLAACGLIAIAYGVALMRKASE